ncbi:MAG: hypothetical protein KC503_20390 [Myxococcales bacterium]|nr:hypothetical protein [Myxococcales bacterium]
MTRGALLALISAWLLVASCRPSDPRALRAEDFPSARVAASTLSAGGEPGTWRSFGAPRVEQKPLRVLSRTPQGDAAGARSINVVFNQPMVRLGAVGRSTEPLPLRIQPALRMTHRWVSGDTLKVELLDTLRAAHTYRVTLAASTRALSGQTLGRALSWTFNSRRPRVLRVRVVPKHAKRYHRVLPGDRFIIETSQKVEPSALARHVTLVAGKGKKARPLRFKLERPATPKSAREVLLVPAPGQLAPGSALTIRVRAGWRGREGPLLATRDFKTATMLVLRRPLANIDCNERGADMQRLFRPGAAVGTPTRCWSVPTREAPVRFSFSEPVERRALLRALTITPAIPNLARRLEASYDRCSGEKAARVCSRTYRITGALRTRALYSVRIAASLRDVHGRALARAQSLRFQTIGLPPGFFVARDEQGLRERSRAIELETVNTRSVRARIANYTGAKLARMVTCLGDHGVGKCRKKIAPGAKSERVIKTAGARDRVLTHRLAALPAGINFVTFDSPEVIDRERKRIERTRFFFVSGVGLHGRLSPYGLFVWVTSLDRGRPLAGSGVALALYNGRSGRVLWRGSPGADGTVHVARQKLGKGFELTDKQRSAPPLVLVARRSGDVSYLPLVSSHMNTGRDTGVLAPPRLASDWRNAQVHTRGYVSTDRGIYRPGERVYVHGALRRYQGWRGHPARAGLEVKLTITGVNGDTVVATRATLGKMGVFLGKLRLPRQLRLGHHRVSLALGEQTLDSYSFRVAEVRPPRFYAEIDYRERRVGKGNRLPDKPFYCGDALRLRGRARYFHGAPLDGATYRLVVRQSGATSRYVRKMNGFVFGNSTWGVDLRRTTSRTHVGALDKRGDLRRDAPTKSSPWPAHLTAELSVRSPAYRSSSSSTWLPCLPGARLVAFKRLAADRRRKRVRLRLVTAEHAATSGRVRATVHPLRPRAKGAYRYRREINFDTTLLARDIVVPKGGTTFTFNWPRTAPRRERLYLRLATRDGQGRVAYTLLHFYPPTRRARTSPSALRMQRRRERRDASLVIKLDKKGSTYNEGDVARVTIERRGMRGDARLFVERERTFRAIRLRFERRGNREVAQVALPVKRAYLPYVKLRVVALRGGALRSPLGPYARARVQLHVNEQPHRLDVDLKADKKRYKPRQTVRVRIRVRDGLKRARRAQVVLMAVDEAMLRLSSHYVPDPYYPLAHTPAESVMASELRAHLVRLSIPVRHVDYQKPNIYGGHGYGSGYGSGSGRLSGRAARVPAVKAGHVRRKRQTVRRNFVTTPWHTTVSTDARGEATASFTLPDNLTRFRIMAFAVDADRGAGTGSTFVTVDQPLTTLAALPRFLRVGDRAFAGVIVGNSSLASGQARVTVKASGAISLAGAKERTVNVAKGRSKAVRFWLSGQRAGTGTLRFSVALGAAHDAIEHTLEVKAPVLMEAASVAGRTKDGVAQGIARLGDLRADRGGLAVTLSSTALTGVDDGLDQLIHYPYGCLEQKSSKLLGLVAAAAMSDRFSIKLPRAPKQMIRAGLLALLAMQRYDGGFGYWPTSSASSEWGTAYAVIVLSRARALAGVKVPEAALERAVAYLAKVDIKKRLASRYSAATVPTILYALAKRGRDVTRDVLLTYKTRRHEAPLFARAQLLMALSASAGARRAAKDKKGDKKAPAEQDVARVRAQLILDLQNALRVEGPYAYTEERLDDGYKILMHSNVRSTAMVLQALLAVRPQHPLIPRIVRWFVGGRKQARFRNTQEAAWSLLSMWDYARVHEKDVPDFEAGVWLGRRRVVRATFGGRELAPRVSKLAMKALVAIAGEKAQRLLIAKRGRGTLYYTARLRYARKQLPLAPRRHGFSVEKRVIVLDKAGRPLSPQRAPRLGDTVAVVLEVGAAGPRRYVVIDDPLPAGLEAIDTSLHTASTFGVSALPRSAAYSHRELRDDRVVFFYDHMATRRVTFAYLARVSSAGSFIVPPTKAEEMYTPEVFGHTAAESVRFTR